MVFAAVGEQRAARQAQHQEGGQRAEQRAGRVHRPVHAERPPAVGGFGGERDHRVPGRGAQALAGAVDGDHRADQRHGVDEQQQRPAERGQPVPDRGDGLVAGGAVAAAAVGEVAAGQADEGAEAVLDAVEQAEAERGEAEPGEQVEGQDGGDHLGGDVGHQADGAEREHRPGDGTPPRRAGGRRGGGLRAAGVRDVHGRQFQMPAMSVAPAELPAWALTPARSSRVCSTS